MARDIRAEILGAWENILERHDVDRSIVHVVALELEKACEGRGIRLNRPLPPDDPVADWREPPQPGDAAAGIAAIRQAMARSRDTATTNPKDTE